MFLNLPASNLSIYLDIDREKARALGLHGRRVWTVAGDAGINNFDLFGRV